MEKRSEYIEQELEAMKAIAIRDENQLEEYMLNTLLKSATGSKVKKYASDYFERKVDSDGYLQEFPNVGISKPNFPSKIRAVLTNLMGLFKVAVNIHLELILGKKTYYIEEIEQQNSSPAKRIISQEEYLAFEKYFKSEGKEIKDHFVKLSIIQIKSIKSQIEAAIVHSFPTIVSKLSKLLFSAESNLSTSLNDIVLYRYEPGFMTMALSSIDRGTHAISDSVFDNREIVEKYFAMYVLSGKIGKEGFPSISRLKATKSHKFAGILKHALKGIAVILDNDLSTEEEVKSATFALNFIEQMTIRPEGNTTYITYTKDEILENLMSDNINEVYDDIIFNYCSIDESKTSYPEKLYFYICCYRAINSLKVKKFEPEQLGSNIFDFVSIGGKRVSDFFYDNSEIEGSVSFSALTGNSFNEALKVIGSSSHASSKAVSAIVKIIGSKTKNSVRKALPEDFEDYIVANRMSKIVETCMKDYEQIVKVIKKKGLKNADVILKEYNSRFSFIPSEYALRTFDFDERFLRVLSDPYIKRIPTAGYAQKYALTMNTLFKVQKEAPLKELDDNALDLISKINVLSFAANLNSLVTGDFQSVGSPTTQGPVGSPTTQTTVYNANELNSQGSATGFQSAPSSPGRRVSSPVKTGSRGLSPGRTVTENRSSPGRERTENRSSPGRERTENRSSPGRTVTENRSSPGRERTENRSSPAKPVLFRNNSRDNTSPVRSPERGRR